MQGQLQSGTSFGLNERGWHTEAIRSFAKASGIAEDRARRFPSVRRKRAVQTLYTNIVGPLAGNETLNAGLAPQAEIYARKALAMAEEAIRSDPTNKRARYDLGFAYTKMGDAVSATHPDEPAAWYRKS